MRIAKTITLSEWEKDKPVLLKIAGQLAVGAETWFEILKLAKAGERIEDLPPSLKTNEWVGLYRNRRRMLIGVIEEIRKVKGIGEPFGGYLETVVLSRGRKKKELERAIEGTREMMRRMRTDEREKLRGEAERKLNRVYLVDIRLDIDDKFIAKLDKRLREVMKRQEMFFYLRVWVPCWFLYKDFPSRMLRRARLGDISAMEKLLRLDTRVLDDRKIREYFHQAKEKGKRWTVDRLTDALRKGPKGKITVKKVKCSIAGVISSISILLGHKLTETEIRKLFDAVAHDMRKGDIDTDLPESPEAFAKSIQRERGFWMPTLRPDKK